MKIGSKMRFLTLAPVAILSVLSAGCSTGSYGSSSIIEKNYDSLGPLVAAYLPAIEGDSIVRWGMVREDGSMLFSNIFDSKPSASVNGYFTVRKKNGLSVYRSSTEPKLVDGLEGLSSAGIMSGGLMPVARKNGRIEIVDGEGTVRMQLPAIDGKEITLTAPCFVEGMLSVRLQDGRWGAVNSAGALALEPIYDNEPVFSENIAAVCRTYKEQVDSVEEKIVKKWMLVDTSGKIRYEFPERMVPEGRMVGGRMVVRTSSGLATVGVGGDIRHFPREMKSVEYNDGEIMVWTDRDGDSHVSDASGRSVSENKFRSIAVQDSGKMLVEYRKGFFGLTDSVGNIKIKFNGFDAVRSLRYIHGRFRTPFRLIGYGYAGCVIMNDSGHRQGKGPFREISTDITLLDDGYVHTDFFNTPMAVHNVVSGLTASGWGKAEIGMPMAVLADSLSGEYRTVRSLTFDRDSTYMLRREAVAYSSEAVAVDSITSEGDKILCPNPLATVKYIRVEGAVPVASFAALLEEFGSELVAKGYHAVKLRDEYGVYAAGDRYVIITPRECCKGIYFYVMDRHFFAEAGARIISDAEKIYVGTIKAAK